MNTSMASKKKGYLFFIIILYFFIYSPNVLFLREALNPGNLVVYYSAAYMFIHMRSLKKFVSIFKVEFLLFSLILLFVLFRSILDPDIGFTIQSILAVLKIFVVVPFLMNYAQKGCFFTMKEIIKAFLIVGSIAAVISTLCVISPQINSYIRDSIIQLESEDYMVMGGIRGFGFANSLTSHYGYVQGFLVGIGCLFLKENKWFLFFIPVLLLSAVVNARTGLIIGIVGFMFAIMSKERSVAILFILLGVLLIINVEQLLLSVGLNENTVSWLLDFQNDMNKMIGSGSITASSTGETLLGRMAVLPENLEQWIIGRGYDIFYGGMSISNSDVGWYRQLNYGGIIYITLLYGTVIFVLRKLFEYKQKQYMYYFLSVFLILNTKSSIYPLYTLFSVLMMFYFMHIFEGMKMVRKRNLSI